MKFMIASLYELRKRSNQQKSPGADFLGPGLASLAMTCDAIHLGKK
jgi:hypothetical protein